MAGSGGVLTGQVTVAASRERERVNPRTRRVRRAVLDAAIEVLLERGAHEVTAGRVAEQADVARTTIYRHWPDQGSLLLATIDALTAPHHPSPNEGRLADDLRSVLEGLRTRLVRRDVRSVFGALAAYACRQDAFADAQRRFVHQLARPTVDVLEVAQARGDLARDVDCDFEATLLVGPILHQHLVVLGAVEDRLIDEVLGRWLGAHGRE